MKELLVTERKTSSSPKIKLSKNDGNKIKKNLTLTPRNINIVKKNHSIEINLITLIKHSYI